MELALNPHQKLALNSILNSSQRGLIWAGSTGSGKTWGAALAMLLHGMSFSPRPALMLLGGRDVTTVRGNLAEPIERWADQLGLQCHYSAGGSVYRIANIIWEVRGLLDGQSYRRIQGRTYYGALIDELPNVHRDAWDMVRTRLRPPGGGGKWAVTFNKLGPRHWTKTQVYDRAPELNALVIDSLLKDNPTLSADYVSDIARGMASHQHKRLVENQWAAPAGQVYPVWTPMRAPETLKGQPCIAGIDYGESGVSAAVYLQRLPGTPAPAQWLVSAEYYHDAQTQGARNAEQHAQHIVRAAPGPIVHAHVDPSAVSLRRACEQRFPCSGAWNDARGYDLTDGALQAGKLLLDDGACPALATEIEDLVYNERMDKPDRSCADHATDCLRYAWCGLETGAQYGRIERRR